MSLTTNQKIYYPDGLSPYNIVGDMAAMAHSIDNTLTPQIQITRVASLAEANTVASGRNTVRTVSVSDPVFVWLASEPAGRNLKFTTVVTNGVGTWNTYSASNDMRTALATYTDTRFTEHSSSGQLSVTRTGNTVFLAGSVTLNTAGVISGSNGVNFAQIPSGYRPRAGEVFVTQGSGSDRATLQVNPSGVMSLGRYGPGTQASGVWLPISVSWLTTEA